MEVISRIWRLYETRVGIELLGQLKIPKRETLGPFDWDLMGFIGVPLFNEKQ